ncbi:methylated-DNA--[protein]-cysteine S-methyltransferase [Alkalimonas sp.]|uniref:methylated-DNA--[protein]-cysteine S-methyltransferase n=1 Tax=Alkalimonas sp. TaxID=1872453 RepID=UPI00263B124B|nr:methylated-DNA--[protein]-cysteine S-methyltransferase [Alkalimonas sp.]MCC5825454.1 methylated-DNA--[protein]-cysteine S-methyltransferase [Alkalimonas sp.]
MTQCIIPGPVGAISISTNPQGISAIRFLTTETALIAPTSALLEEAAEQLESYFHGSLQTFSLPLAPAGTAFQQQVWQALKTIPFGETCSYQQIAHAIGNPKAVRAVGMANSRNPVAIVIPCHRVIGANGQLTGYAGGLDKKAWLLQHEQQPGQTRC